MNISELQKIVLKYRENKSALCIIIIIQSPGAKFSSGIIECSCFNGQSLVKLLSVITNQKYKLKLLFKFQGQELVLGGKHRSGTVSMCRLQK